MNLVKEYTNQLAQAEGELNSKREQLARVEEDLAEAVQAVAKFQADLDEAEAQLTKPLGLYKYKHGKGYDNPKAQRVHILREQLTWKVKRVEEIKQRPIELPPQIAALEAEVSLLRTNLVTATLLEELKAAKKKPKKAKPEAPEVQHIEVKTTKENLANILDSWTGRKFVKVVNGSAAYVPLGRLKTLVEKLPKGTVLWVRVLDQARVYENLIETRQAQQVLAICYLYNGVKGMVQFISPPDAPSKEHFTLEVG